MSLYKHTAFDIDIRFFFMNCHQRWTSRNVTPEFVQGFLSTERVHLGRGDEL